MNKIQKNDFIEIEFTGKSNNQIFDTTNPKEAEILGADPKNIKPIIISVGNEMLVKGFDESLIDKELNKEYTIQIKPEKAFGKRDPKLIKTCSINPFRQQNMNPYPGMVLNLDNQIAKVISVSGGRVMMDFNNPLAGKEVEYIFKINKKITDINEKINALQEFFFKQKFDFEIKDNKIIFKDEKLQPLIQTFAPKFKEILNLETEIRKTYSKKQ